MPLVTVSSKYQITLPMEIVRAIGISPGDKLVIENIDDRIVAIKEPEDWIKYIQGSAQGTYGRTKEEIDRYVAEERAWYDAGTAHEDDDPESFADYYVAHQGEQAQQLVDVLLKQPHHAGDAEVLGKLLGLPPARVAQLIEEEMVPRGWVRQVKSPRGTIYRLRTELATALGAA